MMIMKYLYVQLNKSEFIVFCGIIIIIIIIRHHSIVVPCSAQHEDTWLEVVSLLRGILLRHTKSDLQLHPPTHSAVSLDAMYHPEDDALDPRYVLE